jgi:membrane-associated phospholipid phosphatase
MKKMETPFHREGYPWRWPGFFRLCALGAGAAAAALILWPFDRSLSNLLCIFCVGEEPLFLWRVTWIIKFFGKGDILFLLGLVLAIHRWKEVAVWSCVAMLIAGVIVGPMKPAFGRVRPYGKDARSFPSGDAAAVTAFLVPIAKTIPATQPLAVAGIAAIGTMRIIYGNHFPSDVFAGIAIGFFATGIAASLKFPIMKRIRRYLRRSWLAVLLILVPLVPIAFGGGRDMKQFLMIFGPAIAVLVVAPFVRACVWRRVHRRGMRWSQQEQARTSREERGAPSKLKSLAWFIRTGWLVKLTCLIGGSVLVAGLWFIPVFRLRLSALGTGGLLEPAIGWVCLLIVLSFLTLRKNVARYSRLAIRVVAAGLMSLVLGIIVFAIYTAS